MKRFIATLILIVILLLLMTGCKVMLAIDHPDFSGQSNDAVRQQSGYTVADSGHSADGLSFDGKIVIITNPIDINAVNIESIEDEYLLAEALVARFGQERIVHKTWPFWNPAGEDIIDGIFQEISEDPEVRAMILLYSYTEDDYVIDSLKNIREDIFVVYIPSIHSEGVDNVASRVDLVIQTNIQRLGENYVKQAISMGADTIAHYSYPMHRAVPAYVMRRDAMKATAEREGIRFIDIEAPTSSADYIAGEMFITQDLPRQVERLGANTAFFATGNAYQKPIISQIIATKAIFVLTNNPTPFSVYPEVFEIEAWIPTGEYELVGRFERQITRRLELSELLQVLDEAVSAAGMSGRISCWAVPDNMMWIMIGFMYAVEWINGNVPQENSVVDINVLNGFANDYMTRLGLNAEVTLENFTRDGDTVGNYILGVVDYYVFGN